MGVVIGLGGNLHFGKENPADTIREAVKNLISNGVNLVKLSPLYQSAPIPASDQPDFINGAALVETDLSPRAMLDLLHQIESQFGRQRTDRWQARTLDMDLLVYDDHISPSLQAWWDIVNSDDPAAFTADVMCPHPRLHGRAFALKPLLDVLPDFVHPIMDKSGTQLLAGISDQILVPLDKKSGARVIN